jgi:hypothetical protein
MFDSLFAEVRDSPRQFTVYRNDEGTELESQFDTRNVSVRYRDLPPGPDPFLVIETDGEFNGALPLSELERLLEPPVTKPDGAEDVSEGYRVLFDLLDKTVYTALERRQLLAVSREIEDRAFRVGEGTLRVSFQTLSTFESQAPLYHKLASATDLDVHIYGVDDWTPPEIEGITYHEFAAGPLDRYWVLAFDGGPDGAHPCGLVGQEQSDGFDGFWTDDGGMVGEIMTRLGRV